MRESDLLDHIDRVASGMGLRFGQVIVGPGDDAAIVRTPGGDDLLLSVDQVIMNRHVDERTPTDLIARKAIARAVSDLAAMGGVPLVGLATGALPKGYGDAAHLVERLHRWAEHWHLPLVGGDVAVTDGPLSITVTAIGTLPGKRACLRSDARAGDEIFVTGALGGSLTSGRHLTFSPRLAEAADIISMLGPHAHAMIDLSDGLGRDADRVGRASGATLEIDAARLPLHEDVDDWRRAAGDGEDYELLVTVAAQRDYDPPHATRVGRVIQGEPGCVIIDADGTRHAGRDFGWDHAG